MKSKMDRLLEAGERVVDQYERQQAASERQHSSAALVLSNTLEKGEKIWPVIAKRIVVETTGPKFPLHKSETSNTSYKEKGVRVLGEGPRHVTGENFAQIYSGEDLFVLASGKLLLVTYSGTFEVIRLDWTSRQQVLTAEQVVKKFGVASVDAITSKLCEVVESHDNAGRVGRTAEFDQSAKTLHSIATLIGEAIGRSLANSSRKKQEK